MNSNYTCSACGNTVKNARPVLEYLLCTICNIQLVKTGNIALSNKIQELRITGLKGEVYKIKVLYLFPELQRQLKEKIKRYNRVDRYQ
jgi:hypothetical protein